jgi:hypothetical protein
MLGLGPTPGAAWALAQAATSRLRVQARLLFSGASSRPDELLRCLDLAEAASYTCPLAVTSGAPAPCPACRRPRARAALRLQPQQRRSSCSIFGAISAGFGSCAEETFVPPGAGAICPPVQGCIWALSWRRAELRGGVPPQQPERSRARGGARALGPCRRVRCGWRAESNTLAPASSPLTLPHASPASGHTSPVSIRS